MIIKKNGTIFLERKKYLDIELMQKSDIIYSNFNKQNEYKNMFKFSYRKKEILIFFNDKIAFNINDDFEMFLKYWFISDKSGAIFTQILSYYED